MAAGSDVLVTLTSTREEIGSVRGVLQDNGVHLGMRGETLRRYLEALREKEKLFLLRYQASQSATRVSNNVVPDRPAAPVVSPDRQSNGALVEAPAGLPPAPPTPSRVASGPPAASVADREGQGGGRGPGVGGVQPREPPPGPPGQFDRSGLASILGHMCDYEAVSEQATRGLRALASLAYSDPTEIAEDDRVLPQVVRLSAIHPTDARLQLAAVKLLCNLAYDGSVAVRLAEDARVIRVLVAAMAGCEGVRDIDAQAGETVARIVSVELEGPPQASPAGTGKALVGLFIAAAGGGTPWQRVVLQLSEQLVCNEVVPPTVLADHFQAACGRGVDHPSGALAWLTLARHLAAPPATSSDALLAAVPEALIAAGVLGSITGLMERYPGDPSVQLEGIEALSGLVGSRLSGLRAFAEAKASERIGAAMRAHGGDARVQVKGIRAMVCAVSWPQDLQEASGYDPEAAVELTKAGMAQHVDNAELQAVGLEALAKYLDELHLAEEVKDEGGEGLVKAVMTRHLGTQDVQTWGKIVLDSIGSDRNWQPGGARGRT